MKRLTQDAQDKQEQLSQQLAAVRAERIVSGRKLAQQDVEEWIRIIERTIGDHPNSASFNWSVQEGWLHLWPRAKWSPYQKINPGIDLSRFFITKDKWGMSVYVRIDFGTYVSAVNEQLGDMFEISLVFTDDINATSGYFSWRRK